MAIAAIPAAQAISPLMLQGIAKTKGILTGDLVVINERYFRKIERKEYTGRSPKTGRAQYKKVYDLIEIPVEIHLNPLSFMIGGIALTGAALFAAMAWYGIKIPTLFGEVTIVRGLGDGLKDFWKARQEAKEEQKKVISQGVSTGNHAGNPYPEGTWYHNLWDSTH